MTQAGQPGGLTGRPLVYYPERLGLIWAGADPVWIYGPSGPIQVFGNGRTALAGLEKICAEGRMRREGLPQRHPETGQLDDRRWHSHAAAYGLPEACFSLLRITPPRLTSWLLASITLLATGSMAHAQSPSLLNSQSASEPAAQAPSVNPAAPMAVPQASQEANPATPTVRQSPPVVTNPLPALTPSLWDESGAKVSAIRFDGVRFDEQDPLLKQLSQHAGQPLDPEKVRADLFRLFSSGRYRDLSANLVKTEAGMQLIYAGVPRYYIGRVDIAGVSSERLSSLFEFATKLDPGTPYTETEIPAALDGVKESLAENGFYQPTIDVATNMDDVGHQINFTFMIQIGPQAKVGKVRITGKDPGVSVVDFRKEAGLNCSRLVLLFQHDCQLKVTRETVSDALSGVSSSFKKENRLEATISLQKQTYKPSTRELYYQFQAEQGPIVNVVINGVKVSNARKKLLVPVYEEGAVDNDLLNEGAFNIRDFEQQQGYFDVQDSVKLLGAGTKNVTVQYDVVPGERHSVVSVEIKGNRYFDTDTLDERLRVKKASLYVRNGSYSTQLVNADVSSIQSLYRASGFLDAKVTSSVKDNEVTKKGKTYAEIAVLYTVAEGAQQKFGTVALAGVDPSRDGIVRGLMSSETGQPFSLITLANDRDAILSYFLSNGFDHAQVEVNPKVDANEKTRTNVTLNVVEGQQAFIDHVLLSGLNRTRRSLVERQVEVHAGDPLNQAALLQTQRNLYNLALFNEVNTAVQNPTGDAPEKDVLIQITEAKRWDVTYGFGFEAQLNQPGFIPGQMLQAGATGTAAQNGQAGVSPRVSLDVSRINFRGTQQSLTLHTAYGLLEQLATLSYNIPSFLGRQPFTASVSGGYSNVQNITTFQAQTLQGDFRVTQRAGRADTLIYDFQYRRINVNANSLEVSPNLISQLSQPVRVGGPGITYFHDTRDPSALNATRGQFFSLNEFIADSAFGSDTNFNRLDMSQSSYYTWGKRHKYTFARNLRVGFENVFGSASNGTTNALGISNCSGTLAATNATCNPVPLPERLYAGGATSHRGFGINDAGPRDLTTGYPVGGSGVVVNSFELRLPPPTLPIVGDSVSFVIFHDMGNVFRYPSDMFTSIKNFHQPNEATCRNVTLPAGTTQTTATGTCNFNYYSHAVGVGARYNTPVGPIRLDLALNLNPPVYPVFYDYTTSAPYVGQASHFQFFFSIGQAF